MILTIHLPFSGKPKFKVGDQVDFDTPLYEEKRVEEIKLLLSDKLNVSPDKIFHHLKKFVGDKVKKGDVLAEKKSLFDNKKILSDIDGILKEVNHNEGYVLIDIESSETKTKNCFFKGEINSIEKHEIKLKINSSKEYPIKETNHINDEYIGYKVYYLAEKHGEFNADDVEGRMVVCLDVVTSYHQVKLEALGVSGFVSLRNLSEITSLPFIKLKNIEDMKTVFKAQLPYCIFNKKESKIILYD